MARHVPGQASLCYATAHFLLVLSNEIHLVDKAEHFLTSLPSALLLTLHPSPTHHFPLVLGDKVHLVDEAEDLSVGGVLQDGLQTRLIVVHVLFHLSALHIKHVNEHLNVAEHIVTLTGKVVLHKSLLSVCVCAKDRFTHS